MISTNEEDTAVERVRARLLDSARRLTTLSDVELKRLIRARCGSFRRNRERSAYNGLERTTCRTDADGMYAYCSELRRRRTGKHSYDLDWPIMRFDSIWMLVKLSDIVPHVVEAELRTSASSPDRARNKA